MPFDTALLKKFPKSAGVYIMKDMRDKVLYIGKAKNVQQRLRQYFVAGGDGRAQIPALVAKVETIDSLVVPTEKEALLLENTLIKKHQPPYNVFLKDDKSYISLKLTTKHSWPMIKLVRYKGKPPADGIYFGPYTCAGAARQVLDLLNRLFPLRQCSDQELLRRDRPCILYQMRRCVAPCVDKCSKEEYQVHVKRTKQFLRGQDDRVLKGLKEEMEAASESLAFEKAGSLLRTIRQIEGTLAIQRVDKIGGLDTDVWGLYREGGEVVVTVLLFKHGKLMGSQNYPFSDAVQKDDELLLSLILQHYEHMNERPQELLLPCGLDEASVLEEVLSEGQKRKVSIQTPKKGEKIRLVNMAIDNATATFKKDKDAKAITDKLLLQLQERLHLTRFPQTIECFDNAHHAGTDAVSALAVFKDGEKAPRFYRKYRLKNTLGGDDYGAMREVLERRYRRAKEENTLPDLLIVDGGKGQLNMALKVLEDLDIISVDVIGLAKEEGRHDKGMTSERVFLPETKDPVSLKRLSPVLHFLQRIRDEAHRFAITFHRKRRSKSVIKSELSGIPGIGPKKTQAILKHFGSVKKLKASSREEMGECPGLSEKDVKTLWDFFGKG